MVEVVLVLYARPVVVWRAASPEEYAPVGRAREVVHGVAVGRHALAALPADLGPLRLRDRLGQDDEGVDGKHLAAQLTQPRQVGLAGEHDGAGVHLARVRHELRVAAPLVVGDGGLLEDLTAEALHGPGEPAGETRRLDGRAVRVVQPSPGAGDPDSLRGLFRVEQPQVFFQPERPRGLVGILDGGYLGRTAGDPKLPATKILGVYALGRGDPAYLVDRPPHLQQEVPRSLLAEAPHELARAHGVRRVAPRSVAPGSPEAGDLRLEHHHTQGGIPPKQVIRRPEPRETRAQYGHVGPGRTRQRGPRGEVLARRLQPEAVRTVVPGFGTGVCRRARGAGQVATPLASVAELSFQLREGAVGDVRDAAEHLPVGDEGGGVLDHRVVLVVEAADQTPLQELPGDHALEVLLVLVLLQRRAVGPYRVDLHGPEEAHPPDFLDDGVVRGQPPQLVPEMAFEVVDVLQEVLALHDRYVLQGHRRGDRMSPERRAVHEHRRVVLEGAGDAVVHHDPAHGQVARRDPLGEAGHVGHHVEALYAEPLAQPAEGADHRVRDEQDPVLVADLTHPLPVIGRRNEATAGVLHGFQDHGRHELGAFRLYHLLDGVSGALGVLLGVPDVEEAGRQRLEGGLEAW